VGPTWYAVPDDCLCEKRKGRNDDTQYPTMPPHCAAVGLVAPRPKFSSNPRGPQLGYSLSRPHTTPTGGHPRVPTKREMIVPAPWTQLAFSGTPLLSRLVVVCCVCNVCVSRWMCVCQACPLASLTGPPSSSPCSSETLASIVLHSLHLCKVSGAYIRV